MLIFLPNIATNFIQHSYYSFAYRVASDVPKPGQPKHTLHRKKIYIFVVTTYLIYTIIDVINSIPANFYDIHLLRHDFTEPELRSSFRKLQLLFHPEIEEKKFRGKYFIPFGVESTATLTDDAKDEKLAKKLWEFTDDLVNEKLKDIK
ncbi:92_t:CDS:2 [Entrophospora sp. SA101]|nr:92_t:CDS:2 [Entrophospora sp. SA101]